MTNFAPYDFHIHTKYLKCANMTMEISDILRECDRLGVTRLGITDHLNTLENLNLHQLIRTDLESCDTNLAVFFGVELNFLAPDGNFAFSEEVKDEYGFQFATGGIHATYCDVYDLQKIVDTQHRHHLRVCHDPLVDVLVHPYWFGKGEFDNKNWPWFDSMQAVPESYACELGQTAKETGTAVEINACANLTNPAYSDRYVEEYLEFLSAVAEEGALFSLGSDAHDIGRLADIQAAWKVAEKVGLTPDRIWHPQVKPIVGNQAQ